MSEGSPFTKARQPLPGKIPLPIFFVGCISGVC